jgi:hypothetical protein
MEPHGQRSACFPNVASATFTGNVIDTLCLLLWISFWPGFHEWTHKSVFYSEDRPDVISIPYTFELLWNIIHISNISEKFKHTGNWYNIRMIFRTKHTLRSSLMKARLERDPQQSVQCICSIPCECCRSYIGETGRHLAMRLPKSQRWSSRKIKTSPKCLWR